MSAGHDNRDQKKRGKRPCNPSTECSKNVVSPKSGWKPFKETEGMMTEVSVPNPPKEANDTLPEDISPTADNLEIGDWDSEQEAHSLNLTHQDNPVTLHTQCVVCHSLFLTRKLARDHFDKQHRGKLFECCFCRLTYVLEGNLQQHNESHHGIKLTKLKNSRGILPAESECSKVTSLVQIVEGLIDDAVDTVTNGNQEDIPLEENHSNNNCINAEELKSTITNENLHTFEANPKYVHNCMSKEITCGIEDQVPNNQRESEPVFPTVATVKRELKFEENKQEKVATESASGDITSNHRNLYVQRNSKHLKKLRDVILQRSVAKRKNVISISLKGKNGKICIKSLSPKSKKPISTESIKTTDSNANKLEQDERETESSSFGSKIVATTELKTEAPTSEGETEAPTAEGGPEVPTTESKTEASTTEDETEAPTTEGGPEAPKSLNDDKALTIEDFDEYMYTKNKHENVTAENTLSVEATSADAPVSQDKKGPLDKDMVKDATVSSESYSKDGRLLCKHCNTSFKTKHTLRKHTLYSSVHKLNTNGEPLEREICYDCTSTFANKNNLLRHQLFKCYFRNKTRETPIQLCDVGGNAHVSEIPKKLTPAAYTSSWKSTEKNIFMDGPSTINVPCDRNKGQDNACVQHTNLVENHGKIKVHENTHIQIMDLTEKKAVDCFPQANSASVQDSGDKPSNEKLHDGDDRPTIDHSVFMVEDREQIHQKHDIPREAVARNCERKGMAFNAETIIERRTGTVNDSTIAVSIELPGIEVQTKIPEKKRKYTPTTCDGCGAPFSSPRNCRRHILNSCTFYKEVRQFSSQDSKQVFEIPTVDPRKASKRSPGDIASASTGKMPKLQITCKDCGKQFSRRNKYRRHARKHEALPKLQSEFSKTGPKEASLVNMPTKPGQLKLVTKQDDSSSKVPGVPRKLFQCFKCYRCFLSEYALTMHAERFCRGKKIHCSAATTTSPTSTAPRRVDSLFEYSKYYSTAKCCICLKAFATRTECYRHLSVTHRLSRRKSIALEREYLRQQIRLKFDLMMNKTRDNVSDDIIIIPAVNLSLRWKLEAIQFSDDALEINPKKLRPH